MSVDSNKNLIHFKCDLSNMNLFGLEKDEKYEELKIRVEENIKLLKEQIFQIMEMSFKNKNKTENIENSISEKDQNIEKIIVELSKLEIKLSNISNDIENYKKITNERIEKIFKLVMMNQNHTTIEILDNQKR